MRGGAEREPVANCIFKIKFSNFSKAGPEGNIIINTRLDSGQSNFN